jgi:hypothetical protein
MTPFKSLVASVIVGAFAVAGTSVASAQVFQNGDYKNVGPDGLTSMLTASTTGASQQLAENDNFDLSKAFGCDLVLNYRSAIAVPAAYNQKDFLPRRLLACVWTVNRCGFPDCDGTILTLYDGAYSKKGADQICAVYKPSGGSATAPMCFKRTKPIVEAKPGRRDLGGIQINIK